MNEINLSNFNLTSVNYVSLKGNTKVFDTTAIIRNICDTMDSYYVNVGLTVIILYVLGSWFCWWFFNHGYKRLETDKFDDVKVRIKWDEFVRDKLNKLMLGFVVVVVYLNW